MAADADYDEVAEQGAGGARPFWSGTITFGLVSIPVQLFAANRPRYGAGLKMVTEEGTQLQRRYFCPKDGQELDWDDIVRGYEVEKGKYVPLTDEELEAIEPRKSRDIDLRLFVNRDEIDPVLFERGYFLTPSGGSNKAYRLLSSVMERTGRAGIATFVMRAKEYVIAIFAEKGILRAETLRFIDEVRTPADVGLPKKPKAKPADVKKFETAIAKHVRKIDFREFLDDYDERLEKLAERKRKKHEDVVAAPVSEEEDSSGAPSGEVVDLLEVLRRSLRGGGSDTSAKRKPARPSTRAKRSTTGAKRPAAKRPAHVAKKK